MAASRTAWIEKAQSESSTNWYEEVLSLADLKLCRITEQQVGYQRVLDEPRIERMVADFDASEARTLYVSLRGGQYWVMDGQHTMEALIRKGFTHWICRVFTGLTFAEEALRFVEYQKNSRRIDPVTNWNAEILHGEPRTVSIESVLSKHKIRIGTTTLRVKDGHLNVKCLTAFENIYDCGEEERLHDFPARGGTLVLDETLATLTAAFGKEPATFKSRVLNGMGYMLGRATPHSSAEPGQPLFELERLISILREATSVNGIVDAMGHKIGGGSAARKGATVILTHYLTGTTTYPRIKSNVGPKLPPPARITKT